MKQTCVKDLIQYDILFFKMSYSVEKEFIYEISIRKNIKFMKR